MKQKQKATCPKADRCVYADECIPGVFRGEYLCFDDGMHNNDKRITGGEDRRKIKKKTRRTRK